jgi:hypothetical protein
MKLSPRIRGAVEGPLGCVGILALGLVVFGTPALLAWGLVARTNWPWWTDVAAALVVGALLANPLAGATVFCLAKLQSWLRAKE